MEEYYKYEKRQKGSERGGPPSACGRKGPAVLPYSRCYLQYYRAGIHWCSDLDQCSPGKISFRTGCGAAGDFRVYCTGNVQQTWD